jgi:hypothetical protein
MHIVQSELDARKAARHRFKNDHALEKGSQDWRHDFTSEVGEKQGDVLGLTSIRLLKICSRAGTSTKTHQKAMRSRKIF